MTLQANAKLVRTGRQSFRVSNEVCTALLLLHAHTNIYAIFYVRQDSSHNIVI